MTFPSQHFGSVKKRTWYKVRWKLQTDSLDRPEKAVFPQGLEGKFDILTNETIEKYRSHLEVMERVEADLCSPGLPLGFGKSEEEVNEWMRKNRKQ